MINKTKFISFIEKYYLSGTIQSSILEIKDKKILTRFMVPTKDLVGTIELSDFDFEDCEIGVYYTSVLLKMLSILDNNVEAEVGYSKDEKVHSLMIEDANGKQINYATADLELIERVDKKTFSKGYEIKFLLTQKLIDDILKSVSAIDTNSITLMSEKDKMFLIFGYSKNNTNQIKFEIDCETKEKIDTISFNVSNLKNILLANKKFTEGYIQVSKLGMMRVYFEDDKTTAEYFLVKLQDA